MARPTEPMDVDCMDSNFDNKENTCHNVPCTEKGYEELDVSELNMKLRYSMTPASSPMSKSYTACPDNRYLETGDTLHYSIENANLTRSLNSTMTKNDNVIKSLKSLPLQSLRTDHFADENGNPSVLRQLSSTEDANVTVTISGTNDIDENLSLPSSSSSALHTPEATTPTKEIKDEASPIMRGLKSVLNMFRSSTSPVPPTEREDIIGKQETGSADGTICDVKQPPVASTPIATHRSKDSSMSKRSSPYKDSIVFNDDLEKELNWKDKKTASSPEKMSIHKLLLQNSKNSPEGKTVEADLNSSNADNNFQSIVEYMDISNNESIIIQDKTMTEIQPNKFHEVSVAMDSDSEFVDCETTFSKNESYVLDVKPIQEKISPKPTKSTEFLDCDSRNESYVLDIKEIQEKIFAKSNLNETHHISCATKNTSAVNQSLDGNITSMSFADLDSKLKMIVSSDYSQTTTEILSELDKLEANMSSEVNTKKHADMYENITEQKDVTEQQVHTSEVLASNVTVNETSLDQKNKDTESQENQLNITENTCSGLEINITEQNTDITPKMIDGPHTVIDTVQHTESPVESGNNISQSQEVKSIQDNSNDGYSTLTSQPESPHLNINADQTQDTGFTIECNKKVNENITDIKVITQESTKTSLAISNNIAETVPSEIPNVIQKDIKSVDILNVIQNDVIPVEVVDSLHENILPLEVLNVTLHDVIPEAVDISPADLPLPDEILKPLKTLDVAENVTEIQTTEVQKTENPSDIPLPDDDVDKEDVVSEIPITFVDTAPAVNSDSIISMSESNVTGLVPEHVEIVDISIENKNNCDSVLTFETSGAQLSELHTPENTDTEPSDRKTPENVLSRTERINEIVLPELKNLHFETDSNLHLDEALAMTNFNITATEMFDERSTLTKNNDNNTLSEVHPSPYVSSAVNVSKIIDDPHFTNNLDKNIVTTDILAHEQNISQIEPMDITLNESLNLTHELPDLVNQTIVLAEENVQNQVIANFVVNDPKVQSVSNLPDVENVENSETSKNLSTEIKRGFDWEVNSEINVLDNISDNSNITEVHLPINGEKQPTSGAENIQIENVTMNISDNISVTENSNIIEVHLPINDEKQPTNGAENVQFENVTMNISDNISVNENSKITEVHLPIDDVKQPTSGAENVHIENLIMNISDDEPPKIFTNTPDSEPMEIERTTVDEEIIVSANNSPYVSLMSDIETVSEKNGDPEKADDAFEEIENPFISTTNVPSSPPITSKGYNFNFEDIDDPFATKTKIRLSPPLDSPSKPIETENEKDKQFKVPKKGVTNRRKSQPLDRKKPNAMKKKFNASFDANSTSKTTTNKTDNEPKEKTNTRETLECEQISELTTQEHNFNEIKDKKEVKNEDQTEQKVANTSENYLQTSEENKSLIDSVHAVSSDLKTTSSSEQSTYYSAGASSTESFKSKNVFNLPEIDDVNFNPFATKSKMRQSPPPDIEIDNPFATKSKMRQSPPPNTAFDKSFATTSKIRSSPDVSIISHSKLDTNRTLTLDADKMETELMEKDTSANITDTTSSSRVSDNLNLTTREVNTEDEDTIEGPFLDAGDDIGKITDVVSDKEDMMQFNELEEAAQGNEDNLDGELFIDAEAYEFLLNQNMSNVVADSGKESLFLKFDPLFAKRLSCDGVLASHNIPQKKQSTPTKLTRPSLRNEASPIAGPSTLNVTYEGDNNVSQESNDDVNITVTKPTMVVTPALNPIVTPRNKTVTPVRINRRSITFTSPAIAVIDRLLSMSANNSILGHDTTVTSTQSNGEQTEADLALTQLRELLAEKEISVYNLRSESKELKDRLSIMESQVRILESDGQERLKKINELNERLAEKTKINKSMAAVVEEYERTIASLIADIEQDKKRNAEERIRLTNERDEQTAHLSSMEVSFSDLHSKYEKSKQVILTCKANEDICKKTIQDFEEQVTKMQANYEMLKQHATAKLNHANQELEKINRTHEAEVVKLNAMIKRNQLLATSLQETLTQKTKANDELTAICDELINKVGSNK